MEITSKEIKDFLNSTGDLKPEMLQDAIDTYFSRTILPLLSFEQYNFSKDSTEDLHKNLIRLVKRAAVNGAAAESFFKLLLQLDASGIKDKAAKEGKASKEDKEALNLSYAKTADATLEDILTLLESNQDTFQEWKASRSFTELQGSFISSTSAFQEYVDISSSRQVFLRLKAFIKEVERLVIKKALSRELFASLFIKIASNSLSDLEKELISDYIKPIIANRAIASALVKGSIIKNKYNSFTVFDDTSTGKATGYRTADLAFLRAAQQEYLDSANVTMVEMLNFLEEHKADFGVVSSTKAIKPIENKPDWSIIWL